MSDKYNKRSFDSIYNNRPPKYENNYITKNKYEKHSFDSVHTNRHSKYDDTYKKHSIETIGNIQ